MQGSTHPVQSAGTGKNGDEGKRIKNPVKN